MRSCEPQEVVGVCVKWYQSTNFVYIQEENIEMRKLGIMPAKRCRDRSVVNETMEEEMRQLRARLYAMDTTQRREPNVGDVSEYENEDVEAEEVGGEQEGKE
jgi:hypothetical protein